MQPARHRERDAPPVAAPTLRLGPRDFILDRKSDGTIYIRSPHKLDPYPDKMTERLVYWAERYCEPPSPRVITTTEQKA